MNRWAKWMASLAMTLALSLGFARPAFAWSPNLSTCNSKPIVTANSALSFGSLSANSGGTVTVSPNGTVTSTGVSLLSGTGAAPASFSISDAGAKIVAPNPGSCADYSGVKPGFASGVQIQVTGATLYDTTGAYSMTVSNLTFALCAKGGGSCGTVYTGSASGVPWVYSSDDLYIGGTLNVSSGQAGGSYSTANGSGVAINITLTWQ